MFLPPEQRHEYVSQKHRETKTQSRLSSWRCWMCHWQGPKAAGPRSCSSSRALLGSPSSKPHACRCKALQNLHRVGPKGLVWGVRQQAGDSCLSWRAGTQEGARPTWKHSTEPRLQVQTSSSPLCPGMQGVPTPLPCSQGCPSSLARPCPTSGGDEGKCEVSTALSACFHLDLPCLAPVSLQFGEEARQLLGPATGGGDQTTH